MNKESISMVNVLETAVEAEKAPSLSELEAGLTSEFKRAKDMNSFAFHICGKEARGLCGTKNLFYGTKTVTVEGVLLSLPHQNGGWFWCVTCAAAFTGKPEQFFLNSRISPRNK
jgi:hypothetical protein